MKQREMIGKPLSADVWCLRFCVISLICSVSSAVDMKLISSQCYTYGTDVSFGPNLWLAATGDSFLIISSLLPFFIPTAEELGDVDVLMGWATISFCIL